MSSCPPVLQTLQTLPSLFYICFIVLMRNSIASNYTISHTSTEASDRFFWFQFQFCRLRKIFPVSEYLKTKLFLLFNVIHFANFAVLVCYLTALISWLSGKERQKKRKKC